MRAKHSVTAAVVAKRSSGAVRLPRVHLAHDRHVGPADGVDALVDPVESSGGNAGVNGSLAQAERK